MRTLYDSLLDIAKLDLTGAKILYTNSLIAQSLFHFEQSFEKANKSIITYYMIQYESKSEIEVLQLLKSEFRHLNRKLTSKITKILFDREKEIYLSKGGNPTDQFITKPYLILEEFEKPGSWGIDDKTLVAFINNILKKDYYDRYVPISSKSMPISSTSQIAFLREEYAKRVISKYLILVWLISPYFDNMDIITRYPIKDFNYENVFILNNMENKDACVLLSYMIEEFLNVVPLMWERIIDLK